MSKSNDLNFQSVVILGLKTALLEAESEINRLKNKLSQVEHEALQYYLKCGKTELVSMKKVCKLNEIKNKLHQELKNVRLELEEQKKEMADKENENVNLQFKVKELKSLLDIKMELLESLNIKGDKVDKNVLNDIRLDSKGLLKNLKIITKNHPCYPDYQVLDDIRKVLSRTEKGKSVDISKYLRKTKAERKEQDEIGELDNCDSLENTHVDNKNDAFEFKIDIDLTAVKENISPLDSRSASILAQQYVSNEKHVLNDVVKVDTKQTSVVTDNDGGCEPATNCTSPPIDSDRTSAGVKSDSEGDETSGFFEEDTEVESATEVEFSSSQKISSNTSPSENHSIHCMPNLSLENVTLVTNESSRSEISETLQITHEITKCEQLPVNERISKVAKKDSHNFDSNCAEQSTCEILSEMCRLGKLSLDFDALKQFYDENEKESTDDNFQKPYTCSPLRRTNEINIERNKSTTSKMNDILANCSDSTECRMSLFELCEQSEEIDHCAKIEEEIEQSTLLQTCNKNNKKRDKIVENSLKTFSDKDEVVTIQATDNGMKIESKPTIDTFNKNISVTCTQTFVSEKKQLLIEDGTFKKPDAYRLKSRKQPELHPKSNITNDTNTYSVLKSKKTVSFPLTKIVLPDDKEKRARASNAVKENIVTVDDSKTKIKSTICSNEKMSNILDTVASYVSVDGDGDGDDDSTEKCCESKPIDIHEKDKFVNSESIALKEIAQVSKKLSPTPQKQHCSLLAEENSRPSKDSDACGQASDGENADPKKYEACSKRTAPSTRTKQSIQPKIESQIVKVANVEKAIEAKTIKSKIVPKSSEIVAAETMNTMNNGMERRKRKGKYNEILDSLIPKRRKQSDNEVDSRPSSKTQISVEEKTSPNKRRKKISVEAAEINEHCATSSSNSSSSAFIETGLKVISNHEAVSKVTEAVNVVSNIPKTEISSDVTSHIDDLKKEAETFPRNDHKISESPKTESVESPKLFSSIFDLPESLIESEMKTEEEKTDSLVKSEELDNISLVNDSENEKLSDNVVDKSNDHCDTRMTTNAKSECKMVPDQEELKLECETKIKKILKDVSLKKSKHFEISTKSNVPKDEFKSTIKVEKCINVALKISNISEDERRPKTIEGSQVEEIKLTNEISPNSQILPKIEETSKILSKDEIKECKSESYSDYENESNKGCKSNDDVFGIVEEMVTFKNDLFKRHKELKDFLALSPTHELPSTKIVSPSPVVSLSLHAPSTSTMVQFNETETGNTEDEDDDDSADEALVIAEDDHTNDSCPDGIEINKLNYPNVPYCPVASNILPSTHCANDLIDKNADYLDKSETSARLQPTSMDGANVVKFQFYKENEIKCSETVVKELSPFEKVWESIKCTYVPKQMTDEDLRLIECYKPVTHMAFHYRVNRKDKSSPKLNENVPNLEKLKESILKFTKEVGENEFVAVENFKSSVTFANSGSIAIALISFTMDRAHYETKKLKGTLQPLNTLCYQLTSTNKNFLDDTKAVLKNKMFTKTWKVSETNNNGMISSIIALSVFYTMLCMSSNDVKSVKDLLFESLCSMKYRSHPIAYGVLTTCPTIFNELSTNCLLTQIILFTLINHSMEWNPEMYKVPQVREMIGHFYNIKLGYKAAEDLAREAMQQFNDETWVDAIVLLCKRQQFSWSYRNIIMKYLLQIMKRWKEQDFNEMILMKTVEALHNVVRCCPMRSINIAGNSSTISEQTESSPKHVVYNIDLIVNSLEDILNNPKGSRELHEMVAFALCNISHLSFERCSSILYNWKPAQGVISNKALEKLHSCVRSTMMLQRWHQFVAPKQSANKYKGRKYNKEVKPIQDGMIRVGISQHSRVPTDEKKKKKKKKKNKRKK